jgi:hypothetical protein
MVPNETIQWDFQAKADLAAWLAHPSELGRQPDELEIVDSRELAWPPDGARRRMWLIKYIVRAGTALEEDKVGCGIAGRVTYGRFSNDLDQRPIEDVYTIHAFWDMEMNARLIDRWDI